MLIYSKGLVLGLGCLLLCIYEIDSKYMIPVAWNLWDVLCTIMH